MSNPPAHIPSLQYGDSTRNALTQIAILIGRAQQIPRSPSLTPPATTMPSTLVTTSPPEQPTITPASSTPAVSSPNAPDFSSPLQQPSTEPVPPSPAVQSPPVPESQKNSTDPFYTSQVEESSSTPVPTIHRSILRPFSPPLINNPPS